MCVCVCVLSFVGSPLHIVTFKYIFVFSVGWLGGLDRWFSATLGGPGERTRSRRPPPSSTVRPRPDSPRFCDFCCSRLFLLLFHVAWCRYFTPAVFILNYFHPSFSFCPPLILFSLLFLLYFPISTPFTFTVFCKFTFLWILNHIYMLNHKGY